jgi:uncharacterized alkaline shock family protein YloU
MLAPPADPAERGTTTLAPRVVEKVASQAAGETEQVFGLPRRLAGRALGGERVRASATVDGHLAAVEIELAAAFPAPLIELTRRVRDHVSSRLTSLCGVRVDYVDVTVAALRPPETSRRRVR